MARLSNVSVVVPLPSFDIDPLKTFDEGFFDRAVDNILSEEASIEESRDGMMDVSTDISSPLGYDGASDSSKLGVRRSRRTEAKPAHFSNPSTSSSPTTSTAKNQKSRRSSRIRKSVTMEGLDGDDEPLMSLENIKQPRREFTEAEHYPVPEASVHPSAPTQMTESSELPTHGNEMTAEEKIFASVDPEKQMDVLKFIVSHSFMMEHAQPVRRSARQEFTGQVREFASEAGMDDTAIDALIDHVRNTFLEERGIPVAEYAGSAFGDEVDGEEETRRKRRKSSSDHSEDKEHKKSKRGNSDKPRRRSHEGCLGHNALQHDEPTEAVDAHGPADARTRNHDNLPDEETHRTRHSDKPRRHSRDTLRHDEPIEVVEERVPADVATEGRDNYYANLDKLKHTNNTSDLPKLPTKIIRPSHSTFMDPTDSTPYDECIPESLEPEKVVDNKPLKRREPGAKTKKEKNKRKRERRKERRKHRKTADEQEQPQEDLHGVIPSDEVQSKYFLGASKPKVGLKSKRETAFSHYELSIPLETQNLLNNMNLPPDFLSSDPSLSDVPSDFGSDSDWNDQCDPQSHIHITLSPPKSPFLVSQSASPEIPVKDTSSVNPQPIITPKVKPPKHSPYFPRALVDPESCLPFPPIDAPSFGLIQEQLAHDPFRLLIATIFLNRTRGGVALPVLFKVFERYPTIQSMAEADLPELVSMINCLGFQNQRARKCTTLAQTWLSDPPNKTKRYRKLHYPRNLDGRNVSREECIDEEDLRVAWEIAHLPGVGAYSLDSWRIFCRDELRGKASDWKGTDATEVGFVPEWKCVLPHDKELRAYLTWMWLKEGWIWDYNTGDLTPASDKMMRAAQIGGIAREEKGSWILETSPVKAVNGLHESD
ncbi:DNA glycosylase [Penicillium griseofulvum]|uniref:DNA glycosylase n=1 Tax=Penicillium patulum TaxID=5078 RepID=A0A135LE57_PENPA|nr:DNA glycosylase [Penicillium griseofulvum]KXG47239.1 DNA glycosylase [Penicillium griseofulvum]